MNFFEAGEINPIFDGLDPLCDITNVCHDEYFTLPLQTNQTFITPFFGIKNIDFTGANGKLFRG